MKLLTISRLTLICTLLTTTGCASWRLNGNPNIDPNVNFLGTTDSKALVVKTNNQEAVRISNSGMVGIGTATPARRLHVNEDDANSYVRISNNHSTGGANSILQFFEGSTQQAALIARGSGIAGGPPNALNIYTYVNGAPITLGTASGEAIRITDSGNIGIGTMTPAGALDVNGAIYQRGSALHADYVFEQDYTLESIEEHAAFMWANKHLAAIPAAMTDKNGLEVIEMGAHQRGIVEELEKAHIYIEQLSRNNSELERKNKELEERLVKLEALIVKRD
jgi:hypothetical protein